MTRLYARFEIPKNKWRDSNQRLDPVVSGLRSSWIVDYSEGIWRQALKAQYGMEPLEPDEKMIQEYLDRKPAKVIDTTDDDNDCTLQENRLAQIEERLKEFDDNNKTLLASLKRRDKNRKNTLTPDEKKELDSLMSTRADIVDMKKRQQKGITALRQRIRKIRDKNDREALKARRRALIGARKELNKDRKLFPDGTQVRFHARIHNITKHYYDAPNAYPTVKPIEDAGTITGVMWEDDNNACIPLTTFRGESTLSRDNYVVDVIIETVDEPFEEDVFKDFENNLQA